jgi:hypothetical protein
MHNKASTFASMAMVVLLTVVDEILDVFDAKYYYLFDYVYYFHESKIYKPKKPARQTR